jgi:tetratricopeptide (TPR) repeat protein
MEQQVHLGHAPSFVKQSLLGRGRTIGQAKNLTHAIPPILTVTPDVSLDRLVGAVVETYRLRVDQPFWQLQHDQAKTRAYALFLMDRGLSFAADRNYRAASDIFSLCVLIDPNYFFDYLLATARFKLGDYHGSLSLMEQALAKIRARQALASELAQFARDSKFSENFYTFYITVLLFNNQLALAKAMVEFVLKQNIVTAPVKLLSLVRQYRITADKQMLAFLSQVALEKINQIVDENIKNQLLLELRQVLAS